MITSLDNKTVKELAKLHQKKYRTDSFLLLDDISIKVAKEKGLLKRLIYTGDMPFEFADYLEVSEEVLNKISKRNDLKYLGLASLIKENDDYGDRVLILDHLQDPLNIGRIMEACQQFGFDSIILSEGCADIYNDKCVSLSKGGLFNLKISIKNLESAIRELQKNDYKVYATGLSNNNFELHEVEKTSKMAFILGNEGSGVEKRLMDISDGIIKIDMHNIDSLNVAMAASIVMYRFRILP